jgi:hypothetical protein
MKRLPNKTCIEMVWDIRRKSIDIPVQKVQQIQNNTIKRIRVEKKMKTLE